MFTKITETNGNKYLQIVQSYRDKNGKPRHRVILSLGRMELLDQNFVKELVSTLAKLNKDLAVLDKGAEFLSESAIFGSVLAIESMWERLGFSEKLEHVKKRYNIEFDLNKAVKLMVLNRLISPRSKLGTNNWKKNIHGDFSDVQLQHLYRALDVLAESKPFLESELYKTSQSLFKPEVQLVFYDLTTTYFESQAPDEFRRFGYSKDNKTDCTQVVIGLLVSKDGIPLGYDVFPGNTVESHTIAQMLEKLRNNFHIEKLVFVGDKGLLSNKVLKQIEALGYEYIVAAKLPSLAKEHHGKILDKSHYRVINDDLSASEFNLPDKHLVLCHSKERARRDCKMREETVKKLTKKIKDDMKSLLVKPQYKRFLDISGAKVAIANDKINANSHWDGFFGFYTNNRNLSAEQVISAYKLLWQVEDSFRCLKSTLNLRPIFHWTPKRIKGHIMLCFLSFYILRAMARKLHEPKLAITPEQALQELSEIRTVKIKTTSSVIYARTEISGVKADIFRALSLKFPPTILKEVNL